MSNRYETDEARALAQAGRCWHCRNPLKPVRGSGVPRRFTRRVALHVFADSLILSAHAGCHENWTWQIAQHGFVARLATRTGRNVSHRIPPTVEALLAEQEAIDDAAE